MINNNTGLKRTGKSCRLRWLNYLRPDVKRGNITLQEQLLILELHSRWGNRYHFLNSDHELSPYFSHLSGYILRNSVFDLRKYEMTYLIFNWSMFEHHRWSKIAQYLPGRTDNEIKNYWRTRVQKQAKQLKCDVNSKQFKDAMRYVWMPRLIERIRAMATSKSQFLDGPTNPYSPDPCSNNQTGHIPNQSHAPVSSGPPDPYLRSAVSSTSSDSSEAQVSSDLFDSYDLPGGNYSGNFQNESGLIQQGLDIIQTYDDQHNNIGWFGGGDTLDISLWDDEENMYWILQQHELGDAIEV